MGTRINGNMFTHASVEVRVGSRLITKFKSISYSDGVEAPFGRGAGRDQSPIGQGAGQYAAENVTATIEKTEAKELRDSLAQQSSNRRAFGAVYFDIVVQYEEDDGDGGLRTITDTLERCRWAKNKGGSEGSADPLYDEVEFTCTRIRWNGKTLFTEREEQT